MRRVFNFACAIMLGMVGASPSFAQAASEMFTIGKRQYDEERYGEARITFDAACKAANDEACYYLGLIYFRGHGVEKDQLRSLELFRPVCSRGHADACGQAGTVLNHVAGREGEGLSLMAKGCELGSTIGCTNLGVAYYQGKGTQRNISTALRYYEQSCSMGSDTACGNYAFAAIENEPTVAQRHKAVGTFKRLCDEGNTRACGPYAEQYLLLNRDSIPKNTAEWPQFFETLIQYSEKGCFGGTAAQHKKGCAMGQQLTFFILGNSGEDFRIPFDTVRKTAKRHTRFYRAANCAGTDCGRFKNGMTFSETRSEILDMVAPQDVCGAADRPVLSPGKSNADRHLQRVNAAIDCRKAYFSRMKRRVGQAIRAGGGNFTETEQGFSVKYDNWGTLGKMAMKRIEANSLYMDELLKVEVARLSAMYGFRNAS